ncbi:cysteine-rich receptor-like protein kinase 15 [Carex littledalei]|uniref:non-specific serine/threonine protein kinase n=1 Tax=Carex littledalei TaxID=544730 RepID=A0A833RSF3_9POAL|nr:cysteine-rich receptor-like protein kinase 15 [Carex littledalei]
MCYADANRTDCLDCLKTAADEVANLLICEYRMTAATHYAACFLHYSNKNFLSISGSFYPYCLQMPDKNMTGPDFLSSSSVQSLISSLTTDASNLDQKYASGKTNYMANQTVHGLVQCTRDLIADQYTKCVQSYIAYANESKPNCSDQLGARIIGPNCYIRYELYSFDVAPYTVSSPPLPSALPPSISPVPPALPPSSVHGSKSSISITIIAVSVTAGVLVVLSATLILLWRRRRGKRQNRTENDCLSTTYLQENLDTNLELILNPSAEYQVYDLDTLRNATNNFSDKNKLGQGGFGPVYKGTLPNGQEVAVKRLSGSSLQGLRELKNEVEFLAKLKHKNLVQLLGCCIQNKENILCYEFLPNGSLDKILFAKDPAKQLELGWKTRYKIIEGIGRGLHYLHEESRLKIIHRDLKASNILLDKDMSPKISDFGLARFFGEDQTHIDTSVIAGTFGYMAPEYVMHGNFSAKSDVYSFGVLLLETVTGQRNCSFANSGRASNLISYAWQHWKNKTMEELKDPMIEDLYLEEVTKCVHIALVCVQEEPSVRPNMEAVNHMLAGGAIPNLPSTWRAYIDISMSEECTMAMLSKFSESSSDTNTTRRSLD